MLATPKGELWRLSGERLGWGPAGSACAHVSTRIVEEILPAVGEGGDGGAGCHLEMCS